MIITRLKSAREDAGLTQGELADLLGMARSTYTQIETGRNALSVEDLAKLPKILHRPVHYFLGLPEPGELPSEESEVLELFRSLPSAEARRMTLIFLRGWAEQSEK